MKKKKDGFPYNQRDTSKCIIVNANRKRKLITVCLFSLSGLSLDIVMHT